MPRATKLARHLLVAATTIGSVSLIGGVPVAHATTLCFGKAPTHTVGQDDATYRGGPGDDVIVVKANYTNIYGRGGNDRVCVVRGGGAVIYGGPGSDRIAGNAALVSGDAGNDLIRSKSVTYFRSPHPVHVDLAAGRATGWGHDKLIGVVDVTGSRYADVIKGSARADDINGGGGNDVLQGRGGADKLVDGSGRDRSSGGRGKDILFDGRGNDQLSGGPGEDFIDVYGASHGVTVDLSKHRVHSPDLGTDKLAADIEDIDGSFYGDALTGNGDDNVINSDYGDDTVYGMGGDDTIDGGLGDDHLLGGAGDDRIQGNYGVDVIVGGAGDDQLYGAGSVAGADISTSDTDNSTINGGQGNDTLVGEAGDADYVSGGGGVDTADGKDGANDHCIAETTTNCELTGP